MKPIIKRMMKTFSPRRKLLDIFFDPSLACNLNCTMCHWKATAHNGKYFPHEKFPQLIESIKSMGTETLTIGANAEPLVHPQINELLELALNSKMNIEILSNLNCKDEETLQLLRKVSRIQTSIDGGTKEKYESIRRGGNWELICKNLEYLSSETQIDIAWVLLEDNFLTLPNLIATLNKINKGFIKNLTIKDPTYLTSENEEGEFRSNFLKEEDIPKFVSILEECKDSAKGFSINYHSDPESHLKNLLNQGKRKTYGKYPCIPVLHTLYIEANGNVKPCCMSLFNEVSIGNVLEKDLKSIIRSHTYKDLKKGLLNYGFEGKYDFCKACPIESNEKNYYRLKKTKMSGPILFYLKNI